MKKQLLGFSLAMILFALSMSGCEQKNSTPPSIIPLPSEISQQAGTFKMDKHTKIHASGDATKAANFFAETVRPSTSLPLPLVASEKTNSQEISFILDKQADSLGKEGYRLQVTSDQITVSAFETPGLLYGAQTLRQLLPSQVESTKPVEGVKWQIPCVTITDTPRFAWRGYMQDVSRTFYSVDVIKKYIDVMSLYKINVLHFHLTDDQGWRIEIKKYPKLTSRQTTVFPPELKEPEERSGFYTQDQIKELVEYAADRNVTIIPEVDVPGHSWATLLVYPELGVNNNHTPNHVFPFLAAWSYWGTQFTPNTLDPTNEKVYEFLDNVFTEISELFPGEYIHFGGDEVRHSTWEAAPHVMDFIKKHQLEDVTGLQNYFVERVSHIIKEKGKKPIGWNEILQNPDKLTKETAIMAWLGQDAIKKASENGFYVVATPTAPLYLDITQANRNDGTMSDLAYGSINTLQWVYDYNPVVGLNEDQQKYVLGVQANMWTAISQDVKDMNVQNFPRLLALAENGWTKATNKDFGNFESRLEKHYARLDELKVDYYREGGYISGNWEPKQLSDNFQPLEWDVTPKVYANGRVIAGFYYTEGKNFMDIRKVELLENGQTISVDEHPGLADRFRGTHATKTYLYHLAVDQYKPEAKYTVRAEVKGQNGTNSYGNFTFNLSPYAPFTVVEPQPMKK